MTNPTYINIGNVNWTALGSQRLSLEMLIGALGDHMATVREDMEGILAFIDHIQMSAASTPGIGVDTVYGEEDE